MLKTFKINRMGVSIVSSNPRGSGIFKCLLKVVEFLLIFKVLVIFDYSSLLTPYKPNLKTYVLNDGNSRNSKRKWM